MSQLREKISSQLEGESIGESGGRKYRRVSWREKEGVSWKV